MESNNYYYQTLNRDQKQCYHAMLDGLQAAKTSFPVPLLDGGEMNDVFFLLRLDHPEIFWASTFRYRYMSGAENGEMIPEYIFHRNKIGEHQQAMNSRVKKLARQAEKMDDMDKLLFIHDFICENVHYDKLKKAYSHEIIGPLGQGVGVCEGIAKTVKILCDSLGIWCIIAISENNPEKNIRYRHAWNIVRVGGKTYHLDATFDNTLSMTEKKADPNHKSGGSVSRQGRSKSVKDGIRYDYMLLSDEQIFRDHEPLIWKVPPCGDGSRFFYKEKKLSFTKLEEVRKRAAQYVKKKKPFLFHWRGGYLTRDVLDELLTILEEEAKAKGRSVRISLNWPQAVLYAEFSDEQTNTNVVWEEANEGEKY